MLYWFAYLSTPGCSCSLCSKGTAGSKSTRVEVGNSMTCLHAATGLFHNAIQAVGTAADHECKWLQAVARGCRVRRQVFELQVLAPLLVRGLHQKAELVVARYLRISHA